MKQVTLYTGNGVTLSPVYVDGRKESNYIRLISEDGKAITNGTVVTFCVDVPKEEGSKWADCELPPEEPELLTETEQKARAYDILTGVSE